MNKMNFKVISKIGKFLAVGMLTLSVVGCEDDNNDGPASPVFEASAKEYFNVVYSTSPVERTETYVQAYSDLTTGTIDFSVGFEVPSTRTARTYASKDGKTFYNLNYGGGLVSKWDVKGRQDYVRAGEISVTLAMGSAYPRWTMLNETMASIHNVPARVNMYEEGLDSVYIYTKAMARILPVDLSGEMDLGDVKDIEFPRTEQDIKNNLHVSRTDAPVLLDGKAYYGVTKSKYDSEQGKNVSTGLYQATTMVIDYPALTNPKMITSTVTTGSTYGYRIPVSYVMDGSIYQVTDKPSHILKITDGDYDNSYVFDISEALGFAVGAKGWFYVGDGIGYVVYYDAVIGSGSDLMAWGVARVDIKNKTAIDMNVPDKLSLGQYQMAKVGSDGKLYMALAPIAAEGNVYIFDPKQDNKDGFQVGAKLTSAGGVSYIGIF